MNTFDPIPQRPNAIVYAHDRKLSDAILLAFVRSDLYEPNLVWISHLRGFARSLTDTLHERQKIPQNLSDLDRDILVEIVIKILRVYKIKLYTDEYEDHTVFSIWIQSNKYESSQKQEAIDAIAAKILSTFTR